MLWIDVDFRHPKKEVGALLPQVPIRRSTAAEDVLVDLSDTGLALIDAVPGPARMLALVRGLGATVLAHRDSGPDGVTEIEDRGARDAAFTGFTRSALFPHTDRSGQPDPPDLLVTVCGREPSSGGESLLADGRTVLLDLAANNSPALAALSEPRSAMFGGANGHLSSVFTVVGDIVRIRFRLDVLARFGPRVERHIPALRAAIERHTWSVPARTGTGYVLDNRRWLHGRLAYSGPRLMYRVTARSRPGTVRGGFAAATVLTAAGGQTT